MSKNKLIARAVEYYGPALTQIVKASKSLDDTYRSLMKARDALEDQAQLMRRYHMSGEEAIILKNEVEHVVRQLYTLSNSIDDVGASIEMKQEKYQKNA